MDPKQNLKHVFLIDGSGFIFRAFHALPPMNRPDGVPVNAVFGFTKMIMKLIEDTNADHLAVIFDEARKTFRNEIFSDYKANRPPPPEELIPQFDLVREATKALNIPMFSKVGFEADDIIATFAKQATEKGAEVTIVSSDKDLMQLVGPKVKMFDAMKNRIIGVEQVIEKFGVGPEKVIDIQSLAGDSSDNIPGVAGIGVKTAAQLINEYGDLDTLLARAGEIKQPKRREALLEHADMARISRQLVTLRQDVPVAFSISNLKQQKPTPEKLLSFLNKQGFKSLVSAISSKYQYNQNSHENDNEGSKEPTYELVQTLERLSTWINLATKAGIVAIDTETTGLNTKQSALVGISLCVEPGQACYIPLKHKSPNKQRDLNLSPEQQQSEKRESILQLALNEVLKLLKPMLEDSGILKVGQNIKFDNHILAQYNIKITPFDDTMLLSYCLNGGLHSHGMDELAKRLLGIETIKFKDIVGTGKAQITFDYVPIEEAVKYAAEDADVTLRLHKILKDRLSREKMVGVYERIERPLISILQQMEAHGIKINAQELKRLSAEFDERLKILETEIFSNTGIEFNLASPKQLGEILFDKLKISGGKKNKAGAYSTSAEVLERLVGEGHQLPEKVLQWRQLAKLKSTYTNSLIEQIDPNSNRIHTSYRQAVASTGRLASTEPNLQNIPIRSHEGRKIRRAFISSPGTQLLSADYSQIELRLLAHVAKIDALKEAFHAGKDIHAITASQVFGVPVNGMDPMIRRQAKAINFGIIYGISAFGLARQLGISNTDASDYIAKYFARYPGIQEYMDTTKNYAAKFGFVFTPFGRKCHVPNITAKIPNLKNMAERTAINAPIQGGAADIIKRAMISLPNALAQESLSAKMLLQVHDELIFEVQDDELDTTMSVVKKTMESAAYLDVPLLVDMGAGLNWDDAH